MSTDHTDSTRGANGRFLPGHTGRPLGARNKRPHRIVDAILARFEERQDELLEELSDDPEAFMELVLRFLPKDANELEAVGDAEE